MFEQETLWTASRHERHHAWGAAWGDAMDMTVSDPGPVSMPEPMVEPVAPPPVVDAPAVVDDPAVTIDGDANMIVDRKEADPDALADPQALEGNHPMSGQHVDQQYWVYDGAMKEVLESDELTAQQKSEQTYPLLQAYKQDVARLSPDDPLYDRAVERIGYMEKNREEGLQVAREQDTRKAEEARDQLRQETDATLTRHEQTFDAALNGSVSADPQEAMNAAQASRADYAAALNENWNQLSDDQRARGQETLARMDQKVGAGDFTNSESIARAAQLQSRYDDAAAKLGQAQDESSYEKAYLELKVARDTYAAEVNNQWRVTSEAGRQDRLEKLAAMDAKLQQTRP